RSFSVRPSGAERQLLARAARVGEASVGGDVASRAGDLARLALSPQGAARAVVRVVEQRPREPRVEEELLPERGGVRVVGPPVALVRLARRALGQNERREPRLDLGRERAALTALGAQVLLARRRCLGSLPAGRRRGDRDREESTEAIH